MLTQLSFVECVDGIVLVARLAKEIRRFTEQANAYENFYVADTTQDDLVQLLSSRLTGDAERWKVAKANKHRQATNPTGMGVTPPLWLTVTDFINELQKTFSDPSERIDEYDRFCETRLTDYESWVQCLSAIREQWAMLPPLPEALQFHSLVRAMPKGRSQIRAHLAQDPRWQKWLLHPATLTERDVEKFIELIGTIIASCGYERTRARASSVVNTPGLTDGQARKVVECAFVQKLSDLSVEERKELYAKKLCFCCRKKIPEECRGFRFCKKRLGQEADSESKKTALIMAALGNDRDDDGMSEEAVLYFANLLEEPIPADQTSGLHETALMLMADH